MLDQSFPPLDVVQIILVLRRRFHRPVPFLNRIPICFDGRFVGSNSPEIKLELVLKRRLIIHEDSVGVRKRDVPIVEP